MDLTKPPVLVAWPIFYQQKAWATHTLKAGPHIVRIWWAATNTMGESIGIDAVDVTGALN